MRNRIATLSLIILSTFSLASRAQDVSSSVSPAGKPFGIGLELGAPSGLNAKFMMAQNQGVVVGVGGGIWYDASISLHADYLWHVAMANFNNGTFSGYIGGGGWTSLGYGGPHYGYYQPYFDREEAIALGARMPLGLNVAFNEFPIELFVEVVPSVQVFPGFGVFGQGGLGARFYL